MKKYALLTLMIVLTFSLAGCGNNDDENTNETTQNNDEQVDENSTSNENTVTIMVPKNQEEYENDVTDYIQVGGDNPVRTTTFVEKEVEVKSGEGKMEAAANAAAKTITPSGGPDEATVEYFELVDGTAYVLLNIDMDNWAGSSVSRAQIHPLVEKTLLNFSEVDEVVFNWAPDGKEF